MSSNDAALRTAPRKNAGQSSDADTRRLAGRHFLIAGNASVNDAHRQQHGRGNRKRQHAGDDEGQHLQDLHRAQALIGRILYDSHHDQQHRQTTDDEREDPEDLAKNVALEERNLPRHDDIRVGAAQRSRFCCGQPRRCMGSRDEWSRGNPREPRRESALRLR